MIKFFQNLPIIRKLLLPLVLMGLLTVGTSLYALSRLREVGQEYQTLLTREVAATENILKAKEAVAQLGRGAYLMLGETDKFILEGMKDEITLKAEELEKYLALVQGLFPDQKNDLDLARVDFTKLMELIEKSRQSMLAGKSEDGARTLIDFADPRMTDGLNKLAGITKVLDERRESERSAAEAVYGEALTITLAVGITGTVLFLALATGLTLGSVTRPLKLVIDGTVKLSEGDLGIRVYGAHRGDEIGAVARAVTVFQETMREADRLRGEQERLEASAKAENKAALARLAGEFEASMSEVVGQVADSAVRMRQTAQSLTAVADHSSRQASTVAQSAEQAAGNVNTVAAAAEELSASIAEIARRVAESSTIASAAVSEAERSNATVAGLVDAASRIGEVVRLINDIASQTNLLALNATIEAARAGEAGKGFAVVASEVKNLATQTGKATEEIASQIAQMQSVAGNAANAIKGVGGTIAQISEIVASIAAAVEEQGAATSEIANSVAQAAAGTSDVSATIGDVTRAAAETGSMAADVLGSAEELVGESDQLRQGVQAFVAKVRAA